jgi:CubicO group peptidase (beta-lactamase class C family)
MNRRHSHLARHLTRPLCLAALVCSACSNDDPAATASDIPLRFRELASDFDSERVQLGIPGLAVAILEDGQLAFAHGFGTKGIASEEPVDARTIFRTGSMGKVVTAIGVMSAVDDGLLDLDDPIQDAIPDISLLGPELDALTLRRLLSQQTGLSDYLTLDGPGDDAGLAEFASGSELADNVQFMNPPGLFWNYSNPNFALAGRALEAQTGEAYRQAIEQRVFTPLHMDRSFFLASEVVADGDYSNGYGVNSVDGSGPLEDLGPDAYENAWARPAGFGSSNVYDWAKLMQFLMRGDTTVLSEAAHAEVTSPQVSTRSIYADVRATALGLGDDYGLGLGMGDGFFMDHRAEPETYYPVPFLGHGGDIPGFAATFAVFPSTGFGIVVLSNRDALRPVESIRRALETFGGLPAPSAPPPGREVDASRFERYAGTFVSRDGVRIEVTLDDDRLSVTSPVLAELGFPFDPVLEPTSLDNFALWLEIGGQRVPLEVTFLPGEQDDFEWFRSRIAVAQRTAAPSTAP